MSEPVILYPAAGEMERLEKIEAAARALMKRLRYQGKGGYAGSGCVGCGAYFGEHAKDCKWLQLKEALGDG